MSRPNVKFSTNGWDDFIYWQETNFKFSLKITKLIEEARRDPFKGIGKPEALRGNYQGYWSRRIDKKHRLIYKVTDDEIRIAGCRYHYGKD